MVKYDIPKLKDKIKQLVDKIVLEKKIIRDPKYNVSWPHHRARNKKQIRANKTRHFEALRKYDNLVVQLTKLCVLRSLLRGKRHFSSNTNICKNSFWWHNGVRSLDEKFLLDWVSDISLQFIVSEESEFKTLL